MSSSTLFGTDTNNELAAMHSFDDVLAERQRGVIPKRQDYEVAARRGLLEHPPN